MSRNVTSQMKLLRESSAWQVALTLQSPPLKRALVLQSAAELLLAQDNEMAERKTGRWAQILLEDCLTEAFNAGMLPAGEV